jgi:RNA polymerase subunit RPABC4/transcription elongation factor Spt4
MRFCHNCGAPVKDEAKFCTNCGTAVITINTQEKQPEPQVVAEPEQTYVAPAAPEQTYVTPAAPEQTYIAPQEAHSAAPEAPQENKDHTVHYAFNLVFAISVALTAFFTVVAFSLAYVEVLSEINGSNIEYYTGFYPDPAAAVLAVLSAIGALASGIVSFVTAVKKRLDPEKKLAAIARFVVGIIVFLLTAVI